MINEIVKTFGIIYGCQNFAPRIAVYNNAKKYLGQLVFVHESQPMTDDFLRPDGSADVHYRLSQFADCLKILQLGNVNFLFSGAGPGFENGLKWGF